MTYKSRVDGFWAARKNDRRDDLRVPGCCGDAPKLSVSRSRKTPKDKSAGTSYACVRMRSMTGAMRRAML